MKPQSPNPLLELLDNADLLQGSKVNPAAIQSNSTTRLIDLAKQSIEVTSGAALPRQTGIFSHSATIPLSGGPRPCSSLKCRKDHAKELAQYATLYSDSVYIYNHLARSNITHEHCSEDVFKWHFANDVAILGYLRPLISQGLVVPMTPPDEYCPICFSSKMGNLEYKTRRDRLHNWLKKQFVDETIITMALYANGDFITELTGPEHLVEHGRTGFVGEGLPDTLDNTPRLAQRLRNGHKLVLSAWARKILAIDEANTVDALRDTTFEFACSQCLGTSYLTNRPFDIEILSRLSPNTRTLNHNRLLQEHLTSIVPFIDAVRLETLLELRKSESESFVLFRQSLTRAIQEYARLRDAPFGPNDAKQIYGDIIAPELTRLDLKIKASSRTILKGTLAKVLSWGGAISFGLYTGLLHSDIVTVASTLGLTHALAEILGPAIQKQLGHEDLRNEDMYFLWRVQHSAN